MKKIFGLIVIALACSGAVMAQHGDDHSDKAGQNTPVELKSGQTITRGTAVPAGKSVTLAAVLADPAKYSGQTVIVEGVIVRSCKQEGCWMELGEKDGTRSVRVTFGDHAFFIPLNAAGLNARAQGTVTVKTLPKDHVDHLINDDGAKFPNRNADGSVTVVSFDATGVELIKASS